MWLWGGGPSPGHGRFWTDLDLKLAVQFDLQIELELTPNFDNYNLRNNTFCKFKKKKKDRQILSGKNFIKLFILKF